MKSFLLSGLVASFCLVPVAGAGQSVETPEDLAPVMRAQSGWAVDFTPDFTDPTPIREYAAQAGVSVGVAVPVWRYLMNENDPTAALIAREFNTVVCENEMKFDATEPNRNEFNFWGGDKLVDFAEANGMAVRGHTLVWHSQVPGWLTDDGLKNTKKWSREQLISIMYNHIDNVAGHFAGRVREWDVVNECLADDQSGASNTAGGYKLRKTVWTEGIGEDFIELAFRRAHEADPAAKLFLNDYSVEFKGKAKTEALYKLAKSLVEKGVPIHGVGLQAHLSGSSVDYNNLVANIERYDALGLECIITELDLPQSNPSAADAEERQATIYGSFFKAALSCYNCPTIMVWGVLDPHSWRENNPLLFDADGNPKMAYYAAHAAVREAAEEAAGIETPEVDTANDSPVVATKFYNLSGAEVSHPTGFVIRREIRADGSSTITKLIL